MQTMCFSMFVKYKILTNEILYWKNRIAEEQDHKTDPLCQLCAAVRGPKNTICDSCYNALDNPEIEQWLYNAIVSEHPLRRGYL